MSQSNAAVLMHAQQQPKPAGSAFFAFEKLPIELRLMILEELPYRALKSLERVNKAMRALVTHPTLDEALFRAPPVSAVKLLADIRAEGHNVKSTKLPIKLHPLLYNLDMGDYDEYKHVSTISYPSIFDGSKRVFKLADLVAGCKENATSPGLTGIEFKSWSKRGCLSRALPEPVELDGCRMLALAKGVDGGAVTVQQFVKTFLRSLDENCTECGIERAGKRFKCWRRRRFVSKRSVIRFENPYWDFDYEEEDEDDAPPYYRPYHCGQLQERECRVCGDECECVCPYCQGPDDTCECEDCQQQHICEDCAEEEQRTVPNESGTAAHIEEASDSATD